MADIDKKILDKLLWIVLGIYAAAVLYGVTFHEPWRDEAQSWLLARDLDVTHLFKILPSEGHPPLWYLVIMPFVKADMPYVFQNWMAAFIIIGAVYILLFKTNIHIALKILIPFSYYFFFEYALFARSYCLIIFFIATIISLYPRRFEEPLLFALCVVGLFNTHVLVFPFCIGLLGLYILDAVGQKKMQRQVIIAIALMCVLGLYLYPYLGMAKGTNIYAGDIKDHGKEMAMVMSFGLLVTQNAEWGILLGILVIAPLITRTKPMLLCIVGVGGLLYILGYKYLSSIRHCGIFFAELFCIYAIADAYRDDVLNRVKIKYLDFKYGYWILAGIAVLQLQKSAASYIDDKDRTYSDAKNVAAFLKEHHLENNILTGYMANYACSVLPYLPGKKMYYPECQRYGSFYTYDSCSIKRMWDMPIQTYPSIIHETFKANLDKVILIFNKPLPQDIAPYFDLLYYTPEPTIFSYEMFCVYKFKTGVK